MNRPKAPGFCLPLKKGRISIWLYRPEIHRKLVELNG